MGNVTVTMDGSTTGLKILGTKRVRTGTITMSSSYATGGDSIPAANQKFGLQYIEKLLIYPLLGYCLQPDSQTAPTKILSYTSGGTQTTSTTNLSTVVAQFIAMGR